MEPGDMEATLNRTFLRAVSALALSVTLAAPLAAQSVSGGYLAGRQAARGYDFTAAADYFTRALSRDTANAELMENVVIANMALGRFDKALPVAQIIEARNLRSQAAHMAVIANLLHDEEFGTLLNRDTETKGVGPLVDGLLRAWSELGVGRSQSALQAFDDIAGQEGLRGFAMYHKALALASMGQLEEAEEIFETRGGGGLVITRRAATARAEILSQLDRNDDALISLQDAFGTATDPELSQLIQRLEGGEKLPFTQITSAMDGAAEVFFTLASALRNDAGPDYTLLYARMALFLRPEHVDARLLAADLLEELEQYDLAVEVYKGVGPDHPAFHAAELGRVGAYRRSDKNDAAIEVLQQLATRFPDLVAAYSTLGDIYRGQDQFEEAIAAYDKAIALTQPDHRGLWFIHYARAISHERLDAWETAETDFRKALELEPGQPQVLNYLGYSMVEKRINLDEALGMIEQAVEARPDSGYIVDSLGWVLYRLGRYDEAVGHMERAVELMPIDPVVNDHLGDVYWAVGRVREAEFQWKRALSFVDEEDPGDAEPERMRRKLDVGLDVVLEEEGADPIRVATD
jgi:tetratricopeptide (TPR) repeat protein